MERVRLYLHRLSVEFRCRGRHGRKDVSSGVENVSSDWWAGFPETVSHWRTESLSTPSSTMRRTGITPARENTWLGIGPVALLEFPNVQ